MYVISSGSLRHWPALRLAGWGLLLLDLQLGNCESIRFKV